MIARRSHPDIGSAAPAAPVLYSTPLVSTTTSRNRRPSLSHSDSFRNSIYIVNSNYAHYGHSILTKSVSNTAGGAVASSYNSFQNKESTLSQPQLSKEKKTKQERPKSSYRSLLSQNENSTFKKFLSKLDQSDLFKGNSSSKNAAKDEPVTINSLPMEILNLIIDYTADHMSKVTCLYVNKAFYKAAKPVLYERPLLKTTYRAAQLLTSIRENPLNGELVKSLDFSKLETGAIVSETLEDQSDNYHGDNESLNDLGVLDYAYASWRDWKYRGDPLYGSSLLNSYKLSNSKSSQSVDSLPVSYSHKTSFLSKLKITTANIDQTPLNKLKDKVKLKLRSNKTKKRPRSVSDPNIAAMNVKRSNTFKKKNVTFRDAKLSEFEPFRLKHPYTNKFLLKYANSKDLPIGYILYFIELCPNITDLNISSISLSSDHKIIYRNKSHQMPKKPSLVEDALSTPTSSRSQLVTPTVDLTPRYLSDSNIYFNLKTFDNDFKSLTETDILEFILENLKKLQILKMASIPWLNFKNIQEIFIKHPRPLIVQRQSDPSTNLQIDVSNSGMIKHMRWATYYKNIEDFVEMFSKTQEQIDELEIDPIRAFHDGILRNVGMNY